MRIGVMKWPGGRWIADRSQQGYRRGSRHVTVGPLQVNWAGGFRVYLTWPMAVCLYAHRRAVGVQIPDGLTEGP